MTDSILEPVNKKLDAIEASIESQMALAKAQKEETGRIEKDVTTALENLTTKQREFAEEMLTLQQKYSQPAADKAQGDSIGLQFTKSDAYQAFANGTANRARVVTKAVATNATANTLSQQTGFVGGVFEPLTLEQYFVSAPASSDAIEYIREDVFVSGAASQNGEGAQKGESSITTVPVSETVQTIATFFNVSEQMAKDNTLFSAYLEARGVHAVNKVYGEQLLNGTGSTGQLNGLLKAGNFTAHGYTAATLTAAGLENNKIDVIGKTIGDLAAIGFTPTVIILNPGTWWSIRLSKDAQKQYLFGGPAMDVTASMFGLPVVVSTAVPASSFIVSDLRQAATNYIREGITVDVSNSHNDNFTKNVLTVRVERRGLLAVERPAATRSGLLTVA